MPTPAERHALLFLAAVAVLGGGARALNARRFVQQTTAAERLVHPDSAGRSAGERALVAQLQAVDSARAAQKSRASRPRSSGGRSGRRVAGDTGDGVAAPEPRERVPVVVDVNQATERELERLPRVGPALAKRIVAWREAHGPFRSLEDLRHVRGIGPATIALLTSSVTF
ncbi:MAG: helix-hairpin-helix domain-containing protein [Gemmatimonadaceae bacterium]|nr:helix-hairpin-helix domain-containing protein [Gemmatimonadaceae bacterium]